MDELDVPPPDKSVDHSDSEKLILVKVAQALFILSAVIWILLIVISLVRFPGVSTSIVACLMAANAGMLLLIGWGLGSRQKRIYYMALAVLLVNVALTLMDDFGLYDLLILSLYLVLAGILLATRSLYQDAV